jgi:tRNA(Arg) A34 adenosine deaminase TadA
MNALAGIQTGTELGGMTLWSSHRPCMMCAAACEFTGVGAVIFMGPDPSDDDGREDPDGIEAEWVIAVGAPAASTSRCPCARLAGHTSRSQGTRSRHGRGIGVTTTAHQRRISGQRSRS